MNMQIIVTIVSSVLGSGAVTAVVTALLYRRKTKAETANIIADASAKALEALNADLITPLRGQIDYQEQQIRHLEEQQEKYFLAVAYTRRLFHWLQDFCELVEPEFLARHPKPSLPDELRPDIAPETVASGSGE